VIILQIQEITELITINGQDSEKTTQLISELTTQKDWNKIYQISEFFGQEISILVDAQERIFVDWGSISRVELTPPLGSVVPFKLWLHTHPSNQAYWSLTDQESLFLAEGILQHAIVLGQNGLLSTTNSNLVDGIEFDNNFGWTLEKVNNWPEHSFE
jgi:hypothetical protein